MWVYISFLESLSSPPSSPCIRPQGGGNKKIICILNQHALKPLLDILLLCIGQFYKFPPSIPPSLSPPPLYPPPWGLGPKSSCGFLISMPEYPLLDISHVGIGQFSKILLFLSPPPLYSPQGGWNPKFMWIVNRHFLNLLLDISHIGIG